MADLVCAVGNDDIRDSAVVHHHGAKWRGERSKWPASGSRQTGTETNHDRSVSLYRAPTLGRLLFAPVSPQFPFWLRRAIRAERPDILHLHLPNTSAFWALCIPEARKLPWVIQWQSDVVSSQIDRRLQLAYPFYKPLETRMLRKADAVIVSSPPYLESSEALRPWRDKCCVIPLGLDPGRIQNVPEDGYRHAEKWWDGAGFRILAVGRLTYYKGHEYLVKALIDYPGARAVIVGEGERRKVLEALIAELGLDERVELAGSLPPKQLHALMETCDCMCLPSIERTEAFGMVLLEAMAHRKPAVVCDINGSGVSWVVQDGVTGCVVPPADPGALADAFRMLAADREALVSMGLQGWRRYQDMFHIDRIGSQILELYRTITKKTSGDDR